MPTRAQCKPMYIKELQVQNHFATRVFRWQNGRLQCGLLHGAYRARGGKKQPDLFCGPPATAARVDMTTRPKGPSERPLDEYRGFGSTPIPPLPSLVISSFHLIPLIST